MNEIIIRAGLRHKLSKLKLRAPWYPKGPQKDKTGRKKEKRKEKKEKKERKEKLKSENLMLIMITFQARRETGNIRDEMLQIGICTVLCGMTF